MVCIIVNLFTFSLESIILYIGDSLFFVDKSRMSLNRVKYSRILWHRRILSRRDSFPLCRGSRSGKHLPARGFFGVLLQILIRFFLPQNYILSNGLANKRAKNTLTLR